MSQTYNVYNNIKNLKDKEMYSLVLFALYKIGSEPKYSVLSQLAYILEKDDLFKLCEYFGGMTIKIPTIEELEDVIYALSVYQECNISNKDVDIVLNELSLRTSRLNNVKENYQKICYILQNYKFGENNG